MIDLRMFRVLFTLGSLLAYLALLYLPAIHAGGISIAG